MIDCAATVTVAEYLGIRLRQAGVDHLFGVPGDFNLNLLDGLATVDGLRWVGSPNELGAGYAADAYARRRGLAALITTYGVGELSALNAVAGSFAEDAPVLHVAGSPRTATVAAGALVHHTLADGRFDHFRTAYAEVTAHQETVTAEGAAAQIDAAIVAAQTHRKPVYLSIPQDLALHRIPAAPLHRVPAPASDPAAMSRFGDALRSLLAAATSPVLIAGQLVSRYGLGPEVTRMATAAQLPVVTQISAKAVIDEDLPIHCGDYAGTMLAPEPAALVAAADVTLHVGTTLTAELTGFFTHRPIDDHTVQLTATAAHIGPTTFEGVLFPDAVATLSEALTDRQFTLPPRPDLAPTALSPNSAPTGKAAVGEETPLAEIDRAELSVAGAGGEVSPAGDGAKLSPAEAGAESPRTAAEGEMWVRADGAGRAASRDDGPLTQVALWQELQDWLPEGTALIADTGTAYWGALALRLPADTAFCGQPIWNSIGWALPAVLGQGLAEPERRPVLVIGDGAAQMTVQELGTIAAAGLRPVVLLLNNRGYTIERALQSPQAIYNDVADWNWRAVVGGLTGPETDYHQAGTRSELGKALREAGGRPDRLVFVEVQLDRYDTPPLLHRLADRATAAASTVG